MVLLPLWPPSASPTGAKEAEELKRKRRITQGGAPPSASLALGWYVSRFQRFCRFAARDTGGALGFACWPLATARAESPHHGWKTGAPRAACCSTAQLSMSDPLLARRAGRIVLPYGSKSVAARHAVRLKKKGGLLIVEGRVGIKAGDALVFGEGDAAFVDAGPAEEIGFGGVSAGLDIAVVIDLEFGDAVI